MEKLNITLLGPAHPYRGGLAIIMQTMARVFQRDGHRVDLKTFTVQYPQWLFPGKSQFVDTPAPDDLRIERCVSTVNPFNWLRMGLRIRRERPDIVLLKYWTPFMAPCFGTIARLARRNGHTRFLCQIDNVEPHERHLFDRWFNRWFLGAVDGFVYMSEQVHRELECYTNAPALFSPHPRFDSYGEPVDRTEACRRLGLDPQRRYALFFGLIREYKGLDWLLEAWAKLRAEGRIGSEWRLIVAGECYTDPEPYRRRIGEGLLLGRRISGAALQIGHPERRDADRLPVPAAGDRDARGRSRGDRPRRPGRIRLPPLARRGGRRHRADRRPRNARSLPGEHGAGTRALLVGGDVPAPAGGLCPDCKKGCLRLLRQPCCAMNSAGSAGALLGYFSQSSTLWLFSARLRAMDCKARYSLP